MNLENMHQAFTPQLVLGPLKQSPPNKWTEVCEYRPLLTEYRSLLINYRALLIKPF
jgi:hypothetical protein